MDPLLNGLHIAILVVDGFDQARFVESKQALEREGAITKIVSEKRGNVDGAGEAAGADRFEVDLTFDEADPKDFDAIVLPGGAADAERIRNVAEAQRLILGADDEGKPVIRSDTSRDTPAFIQHMVDAIAGKMRAGLRGTPDEHATGIASS